MNVMAAIGLIIAGLIHLAPVTGLFGADRLASLYGIDLQDRGVVLLMQHRAVLFGLLGSLLILAAFVPGLRLAAVVGGVISIVAFLVLAGGPGNHMPAIARIVYADWIALVALVPAAIMLLMQGSAANG